MTLPHYAKLEPAEVILAHLRRQGIDLSRLTQAELAQYDEFHIGGARSTRGLAALAALQPGQRVLDVGSGVGGPARLLAAEFGCRVTGLDLTATFHRDAQRLTALVGLQDRVDFRLGSALAMPFADASFDVVWLQHCTMNIAEKQRLLAEGRRVLVPGGTLALHEVFAGPVQPIHFPVPWAARPTESGLISQGEVRDLAARAGFVEATWRDTTAEALAFFRQLDPAEMIPAFFPAETLRDIVGNMMRNLAEQRLTVAMAVLGRPVAERGAWVIG